MHNKVSDESDDKFGSLTLKRAIGQGLKIGTDIVIEVKSIGRHIVGLRITAPKSIIIDKLENLGRF